MADPFAAFASSRNGNVASVAVYLCQEVTALQRDDLVTALDEVPWQRLRHAYGTADDVAVQLYAVALGDAEVRAGAWWELWGNVLHQGTVYEATVHAVPFIAAVAGDNSHPDRVQALCFLREAAVGSGDHSTAVHEVVRPFAQELLTRAPLEPVLVQRALLWLLSAFPALVPDYPMLSQLVPPALRNGWQEMLERAPARHQDGEDEEDDAALDRQQEVERWALAGWVEL